MNRREALSRVSLLLGGSIVGAEFFLAGCKSSTSGAAAFSAEDIALLDEIGETIIPATPDSPGAKAAQIGEFMKVMVNDCYDENQQQAFTDGIGTFKKAVKEKHKKGFTELSADERIAFLTALDKEAKDYVQTDDYKAKKKAFDEEQDKWKDGEVAKGNFGAVKVKQSYPPHYYSMIKQLTLWGYFSSKIGATQALRYVETPGKFDGAFPYKKGDKAWA